jgi:hypothetical protein
MSMNREIARSIFEFDTDLLSTAVRDAIGKARSDALDPKTEPATSEMGEEKDDTELVLRRVVEGCRIKALRAGTVSW